MITGKKINELDDIIDPTLETVLPAVKIEGSTISDTAGKLTIQDLKTLSQQGVVKNPNIVTDLTSTTINIDNLLPNTIYQYNTLSSLTISNFTTSYELSSIYFKTSNSSFNLTFTNQPVWIDGSQPIFELNKEYILNIKNGIVWVQGIKVDSTISVIDINSFPATLSTNTNYTATISGSATFSLPTPANTSIENTINLLLNATSSTTVDWGVNANSVLTSFSAGKYELRLRYNNNTSNWIGEVLKTENTENPVKLFVPFYKEVSGEIIGAVEDLSANPVTFTPSYTPSYTTRTTPETFNGTKALLMNTNNSYFSVSNNSKLNFGTGDLTVSFWAYFATTNYAMIAALVNTSDFNGYINSKTFLTSSFRADMSDSMFSEGANNWYYITWCRKGSYLYGFVNGCLGVMYNIGSSTNIDLTGMTRCALGNTTGSALQEIVIKNVCDYTAVSGTAIGTKIFDTPTSPYVLSDNSLPDLHDETKQDDLTTIKGFDASKTQTLKNVQGVLTWVDD